MLLIILFNIDEPQYVVSQYFRNPCLSGFAFWSYAAPSAIKALKPVHLNCKGRPARLLEDGAQTYATRNPKLGAWCRAEHWM